MDRTFQTVQCLCRQCLHCQQFFALCCHDHIIADIQCLLIHLQFPGCIFKNLILHHLRCFLHSLAADISLSGSISPGIKRCDICVLGGNNIHFVLCYSKYLCRHLCKDGIRSLSDLCGAHHQLNGTVLIQYHTACGSFKRNRINAGFVAENRHTDAAASAACLGGISGPLFIPMHSLFARFNTFLQAITVKCNAVMRILISLFHAVFQTEG